MSLVRVQLEEPNLRNPDLVLLIGISAFDFINQLPSLLRYTFNRLYSHIIEVFLSVRSRSKCSFLTLVDLFLILYIDLLNFYQGGSKEVIRD